MQIRKYFLIPFFLMALITACGGGSSGSSQQGGGSSGAATGVSGKITEVAINPCADNQADCTDTADSGDPIVLPTVTIRK